MKIHHRILSFSLVVVCGLMPPVVAAGQIINTLRGFDAKEMGWSGGIEGAIALAEGNTEYFESELSAAIQRRSEKQRWRLMGRLMRRDTGDIKIAENRMGHLRHNYRLTDVLASVLFVQGQRDPFRRLETRLLAGGGARVDVIRRDTWYGAVGATYMYEDEELTGGGGFASDHRFSFFASLYSASSERVKLDISAFYQPLISDFEDARAYVSTALRVDVMGGVYVLVKYNMVHDANPPTGVEQTDQTLRSGMGIKF